ncbi:MAG: di-trans,poly-cis-decaprenylcistransferase [Thermoprotei archaeon]|nr:MAG: di-trans,poly-cis-decaprenylcistransferase [Thermoprotei archaeon]
MLRRLLYLIGAYKIYEKWLTMQIKDKPIPQHVALILDGNRRWARKHGLPPWYGHKVGAEKLRKVLRWLLDLNIKTVTVYALSTENLKRDGKELKELLGIFEEYLKIALKDNIFEKYGVKFKAIGKIELLPENIRKLLLKLEALTEKNEDRFLNLAVAYGGRTEIVEAAKKIVKDVLEGNIKPSEIDEKTFEKYLFTAHLPNPSPDLIIRTSGEERLSNFLLWQSAYSELCFLEVYWPEFRRIDLLRAIRTFQQRQRRFGK